MSEKKKLKIKIFDKEYSLLVENEEIAKDILQDEIISTAQRVGNPSIRKLPIKATTIQSSKGLAATSFVWLLLKSKALAVSSFSVAASLLTAYVRHLFPFFMETKLCNAQKVTEIWLCMKMAHLKNDIFARLAI